ncbi:HAD family hydrolase [Clostridium fungisolvens]|uniref:Alpha-D-glucose 1-phosphate phosphatase YihX n=1 Tax=Clostridium fungisolvens TaxID=1604897 RepID=A0A6V8SCA3_9CLOT|nr:HAD family phosphatase [Clostridium fungisolvens]GFP74095.1 Alpha-D-glucose 1-phosphate phosphatase YihX [Clostridium fungisolvens]
MYKNIIFDIGNVLLRFNPIEYLNSKIQQPEKVLEVHKELFQSEEWIMLDRGTITEEDAKNAIITRSINNGDLIKLSFENWYDILTPIEPSVEVLKSLKNSNYKVYFLSNFHLLAFEHILEKYDFFKLFDGGIVSYEEKLIKPEEAIYRRLIEKYDLTPEESIFIDDVEENVEGAKNLGINTILLKDPNLLKEHLKTYKINL